MTAACGKWEEISTAWNQIDANWETIGLCDTHDGADRGIKTPIYIGKGYKKHPLGNIRYVYDEIKENHPEQAKTLVSIVEPFINASTADEIDKRQNQEAITDKLLEFNRIDYEALMANNLAMLALLNEIERLAIQFNLMQEDDDLLFLIGACVF